MSGVVDWGGGVFAGCLPRVQLLVSACNGRPHLALQHQMLALAYQLPLLMIVKCGWSGFVPARRTCWL